MLCLALASDGRSRGKGGVAKCERPPATAFGLRLLVSFALGDSAFPATLPGARIPQLLVAKHAPFASGTRCRVGQPFGRSKGGGRMPGDIRPKGCPTRQKRQPTPTASRLPPL